MSIYRIHTKKVTKDIMFCLMELPAKAFSFYGYFLRMQKSMQPYATMHKTMEWKIFIISSLT